MSVRLRKNDRVHVISGKDKGKEGKIMRRFPARDMVVVEGVNIFVALGLVGSVYIDSAKRFHF